MTRRQLGEEARQAALEGNWEAAAALNLQMIEQNDKDAEALNRLGRAYLSLGKLEEAKDAYSRALKADPANLIARRNLQRLESLRAANGAPAPAVTRPGSMPRTSVFLEEVGKTWVDELVNPGDIHILADIWPGEQLQLAAENDRLVVRRVNGSRVGEVEPRTARRVLDLMHTGNKYEIFALGLSGQTLRTILREYFRSPENATTVSFPRQITSRAYLRDRDLLRQRDEADFFLFDEDEEDEESDQMAADREDEDAGDTETDAEPFEDTVQVIEEEEAPL
jgi:tetratricopeptide (TPR) repeat protein